MSSEGLYSVDSVDKHRDRNTDPKMRPRRQETQPKTKGKPPTTQKQTKTQGHCSDLTGFCIKSLTIDTKVRTVRSLSTPGLTYKYSHIVHKTCLCSAASVGGVGLSGLVPEILFFCSTEKVTAPCGVTIGPSGPARDTRYGVTIGPSGRRPRSPRRAP